MSTISNTVRLSDDDDTDYDQDMNSSNDNQEFEANLKKCRDALSQNPNDYDTHLNTVNALLNINYINQFRKARDKMYRKFAIPPSVSIDFINLEIEYLYYLTQDSPTPTIQQINTVIQLFENAINDYSVHIKLWINYLNFIFQYESILGIQSIRKNILNKAIRTIGQHFYDAHQFWSVYREFETQHLGALVNKQNKDDTPDLEDMQDIESDDENNVDGDKANYAVSKQIQELRKIWRQQLSIPHFQIEETYRGYQVWESALTGKASSDYKSQYNTTKKLSKYFKKWEQKLLELEPNVSDGYSSIHRLNLWTEYILDIRQRIKHIKPKTIQSLYERGVLECFLHEQIWKDYIEWIKQCGLKFEIVSVCSRSIRNIPRSVHLWSEYIYAAQWTGMDIEDVNHRIFARFPVLKSGDIQREHKVKKDEIIDFGNDVNNYIFIGIAKCEYYRMRAKCGFDERYDDDDKESEDNRSLMKEAECVFDQVSQLIDANIMSSWSITFYKFYIDFISRFVGNIEKARDLWEKLIKVRGKEWNLWGAYIEWELSFGETKPVMAAKRKRTTTDNVKKIMKRFGHNNIYRIRHLYHRAIFILDIESGLEYIGEKLIEFERKCGDLESLNNAKIRIQKRLKEERIRKQKQEKKRIKTKKRKLSKDNERNNDVDDTKYVSNPIDKDPPNKKLKTQHHRTHGNDYNERRQKSDPNYIDIDTKGTKEERTVFVVNLRNTMAKKDVKRVFEKFGKLESIRLPNNKKEKHKHKLRGIGWIEYKHKENAAKCIKELHGKSVEGKIVRVERYRNKSNNDNTVYIKGLSKFTESEAMECINNILQNCGEIKEIRLTKESNSKKIKGFGYIEFVKHESVERALKCDKSMYNNRVIDILPYIAEDKRERQKQIKHNQNKNKMDVDNEDVNKVSSEFVDKLGFVPRSISKRKSSLKENANIKTTATNQQFDKDILNKSNKSQDDFRKLFNI